MASRPLPASPTSTCSTTAALPGSVPASKALTCPDGIFGKLKVVELEVRKRASPVPAQIGQLFALVGEKGLFTRVDKRREVGKGDTERELERIVTRRNRIAHTGDRVGRGRAAITVGEVETDIALVVAIVDAIDEETRPRR